MAEQHGHRAGTRAVDDREVAVAQARGLDADEQLARAGRVELEFDQFERPRLRERALGVDRPQHRAADAHQLPSQPWTEPSGLASRTTSVQSLPPKPSSSSRCS